MKSPLDNVDNVLLGRYSEAEVLTEKYMDEESISYHNYPGDYKGPRSIKEQMELLAEEFDFTFHEVPETVEEYYQQIQLPREAEGWFVLPTPSALKSRYFPRVTDPTEVYASVVNLVLERISASRPLHNYEGHITSMTIRQNTKSAMCLEYIAQHQRPERVIIPAQLGKRHRGRSIRRAHEVLSPHEFGLGAFAVGIIMLTHPKRVDHWYNEIHLDCLGDELGDLSDRGELMYSPCFSFQDGRVRFGSRDVRSFIFGNTGPVTGFVL